MFIKNKAPALVLTELLIVIIIIVILSFSIFMAYVRFLEKTELAFDRSNIAILNSATKIYRSINYDYKSMNAKDLFVNIDTDEKRIEALVRSKCLTNMVTPMHEGAKYKWSVPDQLWVLKISKDFPPLTPLGDNFSEIVPNIIEKMTERFNESGSYGLTWGDRRWTDIGLDPDDWKDKPINHLYFTPSGATLRITIENGYSLRFQDVYGVDFELKSTLNWALIYNDISKKWHYHSIDPTKEVDMSTLKLTETGKSEALEF
ncbi:MAG: hypothetical protein ACOXZX_02080 [Synergistaceae bacterium]